MKPRNIILIRHGQSQSNIDKGILANKPDYACELSELGWQQADNAGKTINLVLGGIPAKFYVSPYWRTRQTYLALKRHITEDGFREDPRIREQEYGTRMKEQNLSMDDERSAYGHFYYRIENGESCADVYDRVSDFMGSLYRDFEKHDFPENAIIVCHGMTLRVMLMRWLKMSVEEFELLANPKNCEFHILQLQSNDKYELVTELRKYPKYDHPYQFNWNQ